MELFQVPTKAQSIVGFGHNRDEHDFYPTPPEATEALFRIEQFEGSVWEPASGEGSMSRVIEKYNQCFSSDIRTDEVYGDKGTDFLVPTDLKFDNVITNPPYKLAKEFILQAKRVANKKIAMFLKLVFLEGINRYDLFQDKEFPLKQMNVFCKRVTIYKRGIAGKNSGMLAFAWYVWDRDYQGKPTIAWIR